MVQQPTYTTLIPEPGHLVIRLGGTWTLHTSTPSLENLLAILDDTVRSLAFAGEGLDDWDTRLLIFIKAITAAARQRGLTLDLQASRMGRNVYSLFPKPFPRRPLTLRRAANLWLCGLAA